MVKTTSQGQTRGSIQTSGQENLSRPTSAKVGQRGRTPSRPKLSLPDAVRKHPVIAVLALILVVIVILILFPSEKRKVKRKFEALSKVVSKESGENIITTARKAQEVAPLFDENCELIIPADSVSDYFSPGEIASYVMRGRAQFSDLSLTFVDLSIDFPDPKTAKVALTAKLRGKVVHGDRMDETREVQSTLKKVKRKWLFAGFVVVEVLKK